MGGGTGLPTVLRGLSSTGGFRTTGPWSADDDEAPLTAIVCVTDDGGSSGVLRKDLGVLPPGDIRNCLAALMEHSSGVPQLLDYRFPAGEGLAGHTLGNLLLAGLTGLTGNLAHATDELSRILNVRGRVLPATTENVSLRAEFACGAVVEGETAITSRRAAIRSLSLTRPAQPLPEALGAIAMADLIVVGPGSLYTSILPPLLVDGFAEALAGSDAVRIYVANLMTEPGETDGFTLEDHLHVIRQHVGRNLFDYAIVNHRPIPSALVASYAARGSCPVVPGAANHAGGTAILGYDLAAEVRRDKIRHAPRDLGLAILDVYRRARFAEHPRAMQKPRR